MSANRLDGRIALITGASQGIGAAVAKRYASEGAHVILAARNVSGLEATDDAIREAGYTSTLVQLDLTETTQIEMLAASIAERFGRLDILLGNAAILGELSPLPYIAPHDWERVMATNLTANWHLIRCFDALLKLSDAPRALFVTSGVTMRAAAYWGAYAISKSALESMVQLYAAENLKTNLKANLIDPSRVRTRMRAQAFPGEDPLLHPEPEAITDLFVTLGSNECMETGQKFFVG